MTTKEEVKNLLTKFFLEGEPPEGALENEIDELSEYFVDIPDELKEWLKLCNAPLVGGEIFLGVKPAPNSRLIELVYEMRPDWEDYEWIPVAEDGLGNYYVLDVSKSESNMNLVYFIDHEKSNDEPCYVVASGLWEFIRFMLEKEITKDRRFPFDKNYVFEKDPKLETYKGNILLPWQA